MTRIALIVAAALFLSAGAQNALAQDGGDRARLVQLYLASIAADRCEFPLSEADADTLVQRATGLQKKLNLTEEAADGLYEEVETAFEKKLPDACKKDGEIAKSYEAVIESIRKK